MANLTTIALIKSQYLNIADTTIDTQLTAYLGQAESIAKQICSQPLVEEAVVLDWYNTDGGLQFILPYIKVPVTLTTLQYRDDPTESWTTQADAVLHNTNGLRTIYNDDGYTHPYYRANITVGYTVATAPPDLAHIVSEMVTDMVKQTPLAGGDSRFGVASLAQGESGVTRTTAYKDMMPKWIRMLAPYKVRAWQT